jgi:hypothetical protein
MVAPADAEIAESNLAYGRIFRAGELLLRLRDTTLLNDYLNTERKIARLRFNLQTEPAEVLRAQQSQYRIHRDLSRLQAELATQRELFQRGLVSRLELQGVEQREQDAKMQLDVANRELESAKAQANLSRGDWKSELAGLEELLHQQANKRAALQVRAPFDAQIRWMSDLTDGVVKRGAELAVLESQGNKQVELRVIRHAGTESLFSAGTRVWLSLSRSEGVAPIGMEAASWEAADVAAPNGGASLGRLQGTVVSLDVSQSEGSEAAEGSSQGVPVLVVRIAIDSGVPADWALDTVVDVHMRQPANVLTVPISTIVQKNGRSYVYVRDRDAGASAWSRREVSGDEDGKGGFRVVSGLAPSETVARVSK